MHNNPPLKLSNRLTQTGLPTLPCPHLQRAVPALVVLGGAAVQREQRRLHRCRNGGRVGQRLAVAAGSRCLDGSQLQRLAQANADLGWIGRVMGTPDVPSYLQVAKGERK